MVAKYCRPRGTCAKITAQTRFAGGTARVYRLLRNPRHTSLTIVEPLYDSGSPAWDVRDVNPDTASNATISSGTAFPVLGGEVDADVCVVGLGGSGLSCIHELLRLGQSVAGIDAGTVGCGAAGRNGGFLLAGTAAFYHEAVKALGGSRTRRIYQATLDEIDLIASQTPEVVRRTGSVRLAFDDAEAHDCGLQFVAMSNDGLPVSRYDGPDGRGLLFPLDASFDPLARCRTLAHRATQLGATLYERSAVIHIGDGDVRTATGSVRCKHVIVAVDGHLESLLPELAGRVRTTRLQMLGTAPAPEIDIPRPMYSRWGYDYWQQLPDKRVVIGGCRDRFANAEWTNDTVTSEPVQSCIEHLLRNTVGVTRPVTHRWAAAAGYSSGILPVMEQVRSNVWAIGGYSGTGNVIGALYGRMVAQLAVTGSSELLPVFA